MNNEKLTIDHTNPRVVKMLARQSMEAVNAGVYLSYLAAVDRHHGGDDSGNVYAEELQREKSTHARSEYPLIPFFWTLKNDDGTIFQEMLEVDKIDPDTGNNPLIFQRTRLNGLHMTDGRLLVSILNSVGKEVWRNDHFDEHQSDLLVSHAREIEQLARE